MSLRQKIWVTLAFFAVSAGMIAAGMCVQSIAAASGGLLIFLAGILTALFWWRCPNCGKGFDPPFSKGKKCARCGKEIDYGARYKKYS